MKYTIALHPTDGVAQDFSRDIEIPLTNNLTGWECDTAVELAVSNFVTEINKQFDMSDFHDHFSGFIARWAGFIGGTGTWFTLADSPLGMTYNQQVMLIGVKAVFSILVAVACGFAGKWGGDFYLDWKVRKQNKKNKV